MVSVFGFTWGSCSKRATSACALGRAMSKSSTRKNQEEAVARPPPIRAHQRGMIVGTPSMKAKQDRAVRVENLSEVIMGGTRLRLAKQRLVPFEAGSHVAHPDDRPRALHLRGWRQMSAAMVCAG